jgi:hypothetical protein
MTAPNRYESNTLSALTSALAAGLDPQQGMSIWNSLQSEYDQRVAAQQQAQAQQMAQLRQLAVQNAQAGLPEDYTRTQIQAMDPNLGPRASMGIDDSLTTLYGSMPNGYPSLLAPPPKPPTGPAPMAVSGDPSVPAFDMQDAQSISQTTASLIGQMSKPTSPGLPGVTPDFDTVRRQVAAQLGPMYAAYQGTIDPIIAEAFTNMTGQSPGMFDTASMIGGSAASLPNRLAASSGYGY